MSAAASGPVRASSRSQPRAAPGGALPGGVRGMSLILAGNALVGVLLAAAAGWVIYLKMRPPLEEELSKRGVAVCRAAAGGLEYAVAVGDRAMAGRSLEALGGEPSVQVAGAWLLERREVVGGWQRDRTAPVPRLDPGAPPARPSAQYLDQGARRYALVSCPVRVLGGVDASVPLLRPGNGSGEAAQLWLLVDAAEVGAAVRRGFSGALRLISLAIFAAIAVQLALALRVIARLRENLHQLQETRGRLVHADKLAALGTLAAGVAHEINNPLSYVITNLAFVARTLEAPEAQRGPAEAADAREALAEARHGAERVRVIVRDLRALARQDDAHVAPVDVRQVMESSLNIVANEISRRARLVRALGAVPPVLASDVRLGQVFLNLLVNAANAIPLGRVERNEIRVASGVEPDGRVAVEVRDTGVGISPANMPRLFDPFFTTRAVGGGTGLGLWVCHGIVTALGGEIVVVSEEGRGTAVRVLLPPSRDAVATAPEPAPLPPGRRARILVVDDEALIGRSIERILGQHEVVVAVGAAQAFRHLAEGVRFDVVICDLVMPEMSGMEFLEALRRSHPDLARRVVFITGGVLTAGSADFLRSVPNAWLEKPLDEARLRAAVGAVVEGTYEPPAAREQRS